MAKENLIIWQKWVDPFGSDEIEQELLSSVSEHLHEAFFNEDDESDISLENDLFDQNLEEDELEIPEQYQSLQKQIRVMATPMGIIPITENTASSKIFNFWVGHTNFDITRKISDLIESTDGVETFDVFTRYRFRIAVGKAFTDSQVMRDINTKVYKVLE